MKEDKRYVCPMHPEVRQDKPGRCPKCGMDLIETQNAKRKTQKEEQGEHAGHMEHHARMGHDFKRRFLVVLPLTLIVLILSPKIQEWLGITFDFAGRNLVLFTLGSFIALWGGFPFYSAAREELKSRNFGMMTLVSLAVLSGYVFSVAATFIFPGESLWWEISTLVLAFLFGHWMEMRAVIGATGVLEELAKLIPPRAHKITQDERRKTQKEIEDVPTEALVKEDLVLVKPGEKIPIDGVVIEGESSVNEAMITGESRPVFKKKGNEVIGGTINNDGSLTVQVTKTGTESALAQIMELIRQAQTTKPSVQRLADKAANILTLTAIFVGTGTFLYWFLVNPKGAIFAATLAITVVVIACPHALGLAIPTVTTITTTLAARNGILIKDMKALEVARRLGYIIFDKTGTLTRGEFGVAEIVLSLEPKVQSSEILALASAVEMHSQHSIARGIIEEAKKREISWAPATNFKSYPGKGAQGWVNGRRVVLGNLTMMEDIGIKEEVTKLPIKTKVGTIIYISQEKELLGAFILEDQIREESRKAIKSLHERGIKVAMVTGDKKDVAEDVGRRLGIDTVFAEVLPEDKVNKVKELQKDGSVVAMVGDGVNDAPAITQANVGIAIGAGTDVAREAGQIVLVKNDPRDVVKIINLSRKTNIKMVQNLAWATGYNVIAIPAAAGIFYSIGILLRPEWAALLMSASSIIVVGNALLLRRTRL